MTRNPGLKVESKKNVPPEMLATLKESGVTANKLQPFAVVDGKQVYSIQTDGKNAIRLWEKLRAVVDKTGFWPLVMGHNQGVWLKEDLATSDSIAAGWAKALKKQTGRTYDKRLGITQMILRAGLDLDADAWLKKHRYPDPTAGDDIWEMMAEEAGVKISRSKPNAKFRSVHEVLSGKPLKEVTLALWPTTDGSEVPALMRYGGWNSCPMPHEQVALLRRWKFRYDAELVAIAGDVEELRVGKPPKTDAAALELAREQFSYCDDIVTQGTMTLERLAECLKNGTVWYFWWD